jgi:hypothetical protein
MARRASLVVGGHGTSVKGLDQLIARINRIAPNIRARVMAEGVDPAADDLVENIKMITPTSEMEDHPDHLKESVHKEDGRHELSRLVVVDAKDKQGRPIAPPVEFGHMSHDVFGHHVDVAIHVPPKPFFYPTIRRRKKVLSRMVARAMSKAVKDAFSS